MKLTLPEPPPCPTCKGPTKERIQPDPKATIFSVWPRVKIWFDCAYCPKSWESCAICRRGILKETTLWNDPTQKQLICMGGCGWSTSWRPAEGSAQDAPSK